MEKATVETGGRAHGKTAAQYEKAREYAVGLFARLGHGSRKDAAESLTVRIASVSAILNGGRRNPETLARLTEWAEKAIKAAKAS